MSSGLNGAWLAVLAASGLSAVAMAKRGARNEDGPDFGTFSRGLVPEAVIREAFRHDGSGRFPMNLAGDDAKMVREMLEPRMLLSGRTTRLAEDVESDEAHAIRFYRDDPYGRGKYAVSLDEDNFVRFVQRLKEMEDEGAFETEEGNAAGDLRMSLLYVLGIEEV